ncbi:hypothetical protein ACFWBH_00895 [Streptomyces sp. NPDC059999]|uniref:hypothetical protein n=1 Tax=Streptomyces sp. NPDC059999 TaxID=3347030 RepID=UPI00367F02CF
MTTPNLPLFLGRTAEEEEREGRFDSGATPSTRVGKWTFTPRSTDRGETRHATLGHESVEIDLRYSSSILEDFLYTMNVIQTDLNRRFGAAAAYATAVVDCSGGSSRV